MNPDNIVLGKTYHCVIGPDEFTEHLGHYDDYGITFTPTSRVGVGVYSDQDAFEGFDGDGGLGIVFAREFLAEV
jgi:hypothetical protein